MSHLRPFKLPNGLGVEAPSALDARLTYHELFVMESYSKHGIQVTSGDCIVDVGANIGLYTIYLVQSCPGLKIISLEPIPEIFSALEHNIQRYGTGTEITLLNVGAGSANTTLDFTYSPFLSITTSMNQQDVNDAAEKNISVYTWLQAGIRDLHKISLLSDRAAALIVHWLSIPIWRSFTAGLIGLYFLPSLIRGLLSRRSVPCTIKTLSQVIREQHITQIDLLKIDVEGSEAAVIGGIEDQDWPKIKQLIIEVHDAHGRVEALQKILEQRGYKTTIDREDWELHKLLGIYTLYAIRNGKPTTYDHFSSKNCFL